MKRSMKTALAAVLALLMALSFAACAPNNEPAAADPTPEVTETPALEATPEAPDPDAVDGELILDHEADLQYAEEFTLTYYQGGYRMFTVSAHEDKQFLIVPEGKNVPEGVAENVIVLQQPITNIAMCSTGMVSLIDAIGGLNNVATVGTDVGGWYLDNVISAMEAGDIIYSGNYKEPDFELLTASETQLEVDTTMLNGYPEVMEKYNELGIPFFIESSSKEGHPLGRVEWVKLFGVIMNLEAEADAYFAQQVAKVDAVTSAQKVETSTAMFYISSSDGTVYARNGGDYMAQMIGLAGGKYIMSDVDPDKTGNAKLTFEEVYARCIDADVLFYVNFALKFATIDEMIAYQPLFGDFKAVKDGNVYITAPNFTQSTAAIADIIADMHTVLMNPGVDSTTLLIKLPQA